MHEPILDMTQRPKKAQAFHYLLHGVHLIGDGSAEPKQEPRHVDATVRQV